MQHLANGKQGFVLVLESAEGLKTKDPLLLNGYEIGEVKQLELGYGGKVMATVALHESLPIPIDSEFSLVDASLLGDKAIKVSMGETSKHFKLGDTIAVAAKNRRFFEADSLTTNINRFVEDLLGMAKHDSILFELRRLNENLEALKGN